MACLRTKPRTAYNILYLGVLDGYLTCKELTKAIPYALLLGSRCLLLLFAGAEDPQQSASGRGDAAEGKLR